MASKRPNLATLQSAAHYQIKFKRHHPSLLGLGGAAASPNHLQLLQLVLLQSQAPPLGNWKRSELHQLAYPLTNYATGTEIDHVRLPRAGWMDGSEPCLKLELVVKVDLLGDVGNVGGDPGLVEIVRHLRKDVSKSLRTCLNNSSAKTVPIPTNSSGRKTGQFLGSK